MAYKFLENIALADFAFEVEAPDLPSLFCDAAEALLNIQIANPGNFSPVESVHITVSHPELDLLLYRFLQELVYYKDTKRLLLRAERLEIKETMGAYQLDAAMKGQTLDPDRHDERADVKAITLHQLEVVKRDHNWKATVIVDV